MTERCALRVKCDRSKHTVATVVATSQGYEVRLREVVLSGYGNRFDLVSSVYPIDGPTDDPETWFAKAGCRCGHQFRISSSDLRAALAAGRSVLTATEWREHP